MKPVGTFLGTMVGRVRAMVLMCGPEKRHTHKRVTRHHQYLDGGRFFSMADMLLLLVFLSWWICTMGDASAAVGRAEVGNASVGLPVVRARSCGSHALAGARHACRETCMKGGCHTLCLGFVLAFFTTGAPRPRFPRRAL